MEHVHDYLIIGGGMAADAAAKAIREVDAAANVGIVGVETPPPYQRPPLSKALWKGDKSVADIDLATAQSGATLHLGRRIESLDRVARIARDDRGDSYRYRRLLLATGATPRRLPFDGGERVIHFRTLDDYQALRRYAKPGAYIAVVGGGFIGSELAASLSSVGCKVTMLFPGPAIGAGRYPDGLTSYLDDYYRSHGVDVRSGIKVIGGSKTDGGVELELSDGEVLRVEAVVAGLGVILSAVYMLWMFQRVYYGEVKDEHNAHMPDLSVREWSIVGPLVAAAIFMGVFPNVFLKPMEPGVARIVQRIEKHQPLQANVLQAPTAQAFASARPDSGELRRDLAVAASGRVGGPQAP